MKLRGMLCLWLLILVPGWVAAEPEVIWSYSRDTQLIDKVNALDLSIYQRAIQSNGFGHLEHREAIEIRADGIYQKITEIYYYGSLEAVQQYGSDTVYWDSSSESIDFTSVLVVDSQGKVHRLDPDTVQIRDTDSFDVFTDVKSIEIQLPGLDEGAFSVLAYERRLPADDDYYFWDYLATSFPLGLYTLDVSWGDLAAPNWHNPSGLLVCTTSTAARQCRAENLPAAKLDKEVDYLDVLPVWTLGKQLDWEQIINATLADIQWATEGSERLAPIVQKLSGQDSGRVADHLQFFASRGIRYVSYSEGEHSHRPHKIDDTLANLYGDCKDKSAVLLASLQAIGVEAYPVLVATDRRDPTKLAVPSVGYFDHMVVCVNENGTERCLDPTDVFAHPDVTSSWIQGRVRLNLIPGSVPDVVPGSHAKWRFDVNTQLTFLPGGGQKEHTVRNYHTEYAAWYRSELSALNDSDQLKWLMDDYQSVISEDAVPTFEVSELSALDQSVGVISEYQFAPFVDTDQDLISSDYDFWLRSFLAGQRLENEHYGVHFPGLHVVTETTVDLNGLWRRPDPGAEVNFESAFGEFSKHYAVKGDQVNIKAEVLMPAQYVPVEQQALFNRFVDLVYEESVFRIWASKSGD